MNHSKIVVNRLLNKYAESNHAKGKASNRRVLLRIDKNELPEYDYHSNVIRDAFNQAVFELESANIVKTSWARKGYLLSEVWLNLDSVDIAYRFAERETPSEVCDRYIALLEPLRKNCQIAWIRDFAADQTTQIQQKNRLTLLCKRDYCEFKNLVASLQYYDTLGGESVTMRAFSIGCHRDSKYFEKYVKDVFLAVAIKYHPALIEARDDADMDWREQLMRLGIFPRPELYELSGNIVIVLPSGSSDLSIYGRAGIALPDTLSDDILSIDLSRMRRVMFIENKTCYDEYILRIKKPDELVFYQGGFISPKKSRFIRKLYEYAQVGTQFCFWGDIDVGGFKIFYQLHEHIPSLLPWKMGAEDVEYYSHIGLERSDSYFSKLEKMRSNSIFSFFHTAIDQLLLYRITIEQECMLDALISDT